MAEASVEVPIVAEKSGVVEVAVEKSTAEGATTKAAPIIPAEEGIKSLQAQIDQAKRESAERLASKDRVIAEAFKRAQEAEHEAATVKLDQVGTILDSLTKDKDAARRDYKLAMEAGDFEKAGEAQERMALTAARIIEAEKGKMVLAEEAKNPPRQTQVQPSDPVELVARTMDSQKAADWVRAHPEQVISGPDGAQLSPRALSAHYAAIAAGHRGGTDAYFEFLNAQFNPPAPKIEVAQETQGRDMNRAPISAPVARDAPQTPGATRPSSIRLEPSEVQIALDTFGPLYPKESRDQLLQRYAKEKMALIDEGKIARRA